MTARPEFSEESNQADRLGSKEPLIDNLRPSTRALLKKINVLIRDACACAVWKYLDKHLTSKGMEDMVEAELTVAMRECHAQFLKRIIKPRFDEVGFVL
jgi:hypothetical protein